MVEENDREIVRGWRMNAELVKAGGSDDVWHRAAGGPTLAAGGPSQFVIREASVTGWVC